MLTKRVIPCLDVKMGRVVKGIRFRDHRDAGDPVLMSKFYNREGADELVFYDITASSEHRRIMHDVVSSVAEQIFIPLTVGGGLRTVGDMRKMLQSGADKISINTAAVENPNLISEGANRFGNQCIVIGLDAQRIPKSNPVRWQTRIRTGRDGGESTGLDAIEWAIKTVKLGAGEIVVNSIDADGTRDGYDLELLKAISDAVTVPIVASGGAGTPEHMCKAIQLGNADAVLAASIFHFEIHRVRDTKKYLAENGIPIRPVENE